MPNPTCDYGPLLADFMEAERHQERHAGPEAGLPDFEMERRPFYCVSACTPTRRYAVSPDDMLRLSSKDRPLSGQEWMPALCISFPDDPIVFVCVRYAWRRFLSKEQAAIIAQWRRRLFIKTRPRLRFRPSLADFGITWN